MESATDAGTADQSGRPYPSGPSGPYIRDYKGELHAKRLDQLARGRATTARKRADARAAGVHLLTHRKPKPVDPNAPPKAKPQLTVPPQDRAEKKLKAKARELGLPVVDYEPTLTMAIRRMQGGRQQFLQWVQLAAEDDDQDAIKFLVVFQELSPAERHRADIDLACLSSGVSRVSLLKAVIGAGFEHETDVGSLVEAASFSRVVEKTVQSALRIKSPIGLKDRHALLSRHGFIPVNKGSTINIGVSATAQAAAGSLDASVPRFLDDVSATVAPREIVQRQLTEGEIVESLEDVREAVLDAVDRDE